METSATISREHLADMHRQIKALCKRGNHGPGSEPYSLLCQLGASLGVWPRVTREKAERMVSRFKAVQKMKSPGTGRSRRKDPPRRPAGWNPCPGCKVLIHKGARHECSRQAEDPPTRAEPEESASSGGKFYHLNRTDQGGSAAWESCPRCHVMTQAATCHLCGRSVLDTSQDEVAEPDPRTICGLDLTGYEVALFERAVDAGELVIGLEVVLSSPLPLAWQRWCEREGKPHRVRELAL